MKNKIKSIKRHRHLEKKTLRPFVSRLLRRIFVLVGDISKYCPVGDAVELSYKFNVSRQTHLGGDWCIKGDTRVKNC